MPIGRLHASSSATRDADPRQPRRRSAWLDDARDDRPVVVQGEPAKTVLFAPLIVGDEVRGRISLQNLDREDAFSESDVRLLTTLAAEPERRPRERPAVRRDEAPAVRDERAGRRAGADQRRPARPRPEARPAVDVRPRRRPDPGDLRRPDRRHRGRRAGARTRSASCTRSSAACGSRRRRCRSSVRAGT